MGGGGGGGGAGGEGGGGGVGLGGGGGGGQRGANEGLRCCMQRNDQLGGGLGAK